jgi:hypothetical protein
MSEVLEATKTYTDRSNAARAARAALGKDKISGVHFRVIEAEGGFAWEAMSENDAAPPEAPTPEAPATDAPPVEPVDEPQAEAPQADAAPAVKAAKPKAAKKAKAAKPKGERKLADNGDGLPKGKLGLVIGMMQRPEGATNEQMQKATGWQPHTVRGAIAGAIKVKLGLTVATEKTDAGLVYRIAPPAA